MLILRHQVYATVTKWLWELIDFDSLLAWFRWMHSAANRYSNFTTIDNLNTWNENWSYLFTLQCKHIVFYGVQFLTLCMVHLLTVNNQVATFACLCLFVMLTLQTSCIVLCILNSTKPPHSCPAKFTCVLLYSPFLFGKNLNCFPCKTSLWIPNKSTFSKKTPLPQ